MWPRIIIRELNAPRPTVGVSLQPQEMHWQILADGRVIRESEQPLHNLVLNNAKNLAATYRFSTLNMYAKVGTNSVIPDATQTALGNQVADTNSIPSGESDSVSYVSPGVYDVRRVREFSAAQVGGRNLTEWGWGPVSGIGNLMSRELFRDGNGNPITLTVGADQNLRLIYKVRINISPAPNTPTPASITIANLGTYNGNFWTKRGDQDSKNGDLYAAELAAIGAGATLGSGTSGLWIAGLSANLNTAEQNIHVYRVGDFALSYAPYTPDSKKRTTQTATADVSQWNTTLWGLMIGANIIGFDNVSHAGIVFAFGASFIKDSLHKLIINPWDIVTWT